MYPNFLILGPPKCASTSLHYYLGQHPDIYTSKIKETNFFSLQYEKGLNYYGNYFKEVKNQKLIGEATPSYAFLPYVAERIKNNFPEMKLILCFRNPAERAFSSWLMHSGMGAEPCDFREAIEKNLEQMNKITFEGEEEERIWMKTSSNNYNAETRIRTYIQGSMYAQITENYLKYFPREQIKMILLDDLKSSFDNTMADIFRFLGVDTSFIVTNNAEENYYIDRKANRFTNTIFGIDKTRTILRHVPAPLKKFLKKKMAKAPPKLSEEDKLFLWNIFNNDVVKLENILSRDLSAWNLAKYKTPTSV
jgi:Sulfotransferase domain